MTGSLGRRWLALAAFAFTLVGTAGAADVTDHRVLANGVEVQLHPRPGTSLVATLVLVKTGYALESARTLGYSHLLEHLVFAGTEQMDKEALFREMGDMGAYLNGFTQDDYMGYLVVGHREHFGRQMELLADILFRAALDEEAVEEARQVVIEEIRKARSRPDARVAETFQALLYAGSSHARTGLGNERTVAEVSRAEIAEHYRRVYRPDNMVVLAAGAVSPAATLPILEQTFGQPAPGAAVASPPLPSPLAGKRSYRLRAEIPDLQLRLGFTGPDPRSEEAAALELLGAVLGGDGGRLQRALEAAGFRPRSVGAALAVNPGFSRFTVATSLPAGADGDGALAVLLAELGQVAAGGLEPAEVERARDALTAGEILGREKLHYELMGKAPWVLAGPPGLAFDPARWDGFGSAALGVVAASYLADRPYVALLAGPGEEATAADGDDGAARERRVLTNGLTAIAEQRAGSQVFALHLMTRQRSAAEPPGKAGIADFFHRMLLRGTAGRSRSEIEDALRALGASVVTAGNPRVPFGDFYTSRSYSYIRLECLEDKVDPTLALLGDLVRSATFPEEEIEDVRREMLDHIAFRDAKPDSVATAALAEALYGPGPLGQDVLGKPGSIGSVTRGDLLAFREDYFSGANLIVTVVSGLAPGVALDRIQRELSSLPRGPGLVPIELEPTRLAAVIEKQVGKPQGSLAVGAVTGTVEPAERPALAVLTQLLNQRLFDQLREREGLAYAVGASVTELEGRGVFTLSMGTGPDKLEQARASVHREIESARQMVPSPADIQSRVNALIGRLQMRMLTSLNRAFYLGVAEREGLPHAFGEDYRALLQSVTPDDVTRVASRHLPREWIEVVVR